MSLIVNLDEFSELCGVTAETMRVHIRGVEGEPSWLLERGDRGRGYKIEAEGGVAWWKAKREADDQASAERQGQLAQMRLDLLGDAVETPEAAGMSGRQRREEYEAAMTRIKLRRMMGELVERDALEEPAVSAVVELRRQIMLVPAEFAATVGLPADDAQKLTDLLSRAINNFVDKLPSPMRGPVDA